MYYVGEETCEILIIDDKSSAYRKSSQKTHAQRTAAHFRCAHALRPNFRPVISLVRQCQPTTTAVVVDHV